MEKITKEQIHRKVQDAVESNSEVLMFFIMQEGYALYPSNTTERYPFALDFDVLAEVAAAAKARNLKLVACWLGLMESLVWRSCIRPGHGAMQRESLLLDFIACASTRHFRISYWNRLRRL